MAPKKKMPKGGRKGGAMFPRATLKDAVEYAKKLVSKTHTCSQPASLILPGVFGTAGPSARMKAAALKQYGLLSGTTNAYSATDLAKAIVAATPEDMPKHLSTTLLTPKLFRDLFDTFCGDTVPLTGIRQQASNLKVHPDILDECVELFVESACYAGLAEKSDDDVTFRSPSVVPGQDEPDLANSSDQGDEEEAPPGDEDTKNDSNDEGHNLPGMAFQKTQKNSKANLEIKIDPSMDPEKLEKLLGVLKKYGQI